MPPAGSYSAGEAALAEDGIQRVIATVDTSFFGTIQPLLGRSITPEEHGTNAAVTVLSNAYWTEQLGRRPDVIGSTMRVDGRSVTVVGVMPPGVDVPAGVALWLPRQDPAVRLARAADETEVRAVVQRFFDAMRERDLDGLRATLLPGAVLVNPIRRDAGVVVRTLSVDQLAGMVGETPEPYDERMPDAEVRIDTDLATVWGRYVFRVGARITNCGMNSFQLLRTDDGWKIAHIGSTIETVGCG